ncbi:hypothetical protein [Burkholderia cepacia]|uniref:hypothetical protein n=1 Tax=Burkholderia cepacia TaxID=292 RepID=UPI003D66C019
MTSRLRAAFFIPGPMNHPHAHADGAVTPARITDLEIRMSTLEQQVASYHDELSRNTQVTQKVESNTAELIALMQFANTGISFFAGLGRFLRRLVIWLGPFITIGGVIWAIAHGKWPEWPGQS